MPFYNWDLLPLSQDRPGAAHRRIFGDGMQMQHLIMEPGGTPTKPHNHPDHEEFFYIQAGEWEFTLEGDTRILRPGDVVHVPKGAMHMLKMTTHEPGMLLEVFCPVYNADLAKDRHLFTTDAIRQRTAEAQKTAGSR